MSLSSLHLDAFLAVTQAGSFSKAAEKLHITQSALSQRVLNLESELESTLFIRDRAGVQLTDLAKTLLRYCQNKDALETEFLAKLKPLKKGQLAGEIRIGGFSSVMRSVILPALSPLIVANPQVRLTFLSRELRELPQLLGRGEISFMILDRGMDRDDLIKVHLGYERNVLVESKTFKVGNTYLDHEEEDQFTLQYLKLAGEKSQKTERRYLGDVYGLLDGVKGGLGKAVLPRHMIRDERSLRIVNPKLELKIPVVLHFHAQPYYSQLHQKVVEILTQTCPRRLAE